jgi:hypothetical protein
MKAHLASDFRPLFVNAPARGDPQPYLAMLAEIIEHQLQPANWWGGLIPAADSWQILFDFVKSRPAAELTAGKLDRSLVEREATYTLQALGLAFGRAFIQENADYDWWMVEDEYGRDPAIRYKRSRLLAFPRTMLSKRIEDGQSLDVVQLFNGLARRLTELTNDGWDGS